VTRIPEEGPAWSTDCIREASKTTWTFGSRIDRLKAIGIPFVYDPGGEEPMLVIPDPDVSVLVEEPRLAGEKAPERKVVLKTKLVERSK